MNFTSPLFVFVVLPIVVGTYWLCPRRLQNPLLLLVGIALYAWGAPEFVVAVLLLSAFDWVLAFRIDDAPEGSPRRKLLTAIGIVANLGVLAIAKYANFGVSVFNDVRALLGVAPKSWSDIALPIGVSFVIFEKISYLVDVSRGTVRPLRSLPTYLLYTFLFPKMFAGPIVRFHTIERQLTERTVNDEDRAYGLSRFALGVAKKVILADTLGAVTNEVFRIPAGQLNMLTAWLGAVCFTLQVYFDFSGYSDMAIGMARCFGFRLAENFHYPYAAASPREYWARWHLSLSSWIRDYLYIPLGGNRLGELRTHLNLWICFLACGLWHGANWTYLVWGGLNGFALTVQRHYERRVVGAMPRTLAVFLTFNFVTLTLVVFRSSSLTEAAQYYRALFTIPPVLLVQVFFDNHTLLALTMGLMLGLGPALPAVAHALARATERGRHYVLLRAFAAPLLVVAAARTLVSFATPFIYFRF